MDIFKVLGFCLCALVLLSVLRQYNPGYAVMAALACCMVLLWFVMQALGPVLSFVETLSQFSGFEHLGTVFKAVAIALMAQSVQDLCMEAGPLPDAWSWRARWPCCWRLCRCSRC